MVQQLHCMFFFIFCYHDGVGVDCSLHLLEIWLHCIHVHWDMPNFHAKKVASLVKSDVAAPLKKEKKISFGCLKSRDQQPTSMAEKL